MFSRKRVTDRTGASSMFCTQTCFYISLSLKTELAGKNKKQWLQRKTRRISLCRRRDQFVALQHIIALQNNLLGRSVVYWNCEFCRRFEADVDWETPSYNFGSPKLSPCVVRSFGTINVRGTWYYSRLTGTRDWRKTVIAITIKKRT